MLNTRIFDLVHNIRQ